MCCHFALYRQLFSICRPLETHRQKAFSVAHPPTLLADPSARSKGHRMAFWRADGLVSPRHTLFPTSLLSYHSLSRSLSPSLLLLLLLFFSFSYSFSSSSSSCVCCEEPRQQYSLTDIKPGPAFISLCVS